MVASLMSALPGSVAQGLIWGILAIGVYITYKVLDFADLTVDGSLATGGFAGRNVLLPLPSLLRMELLLVAAVGVLLREDGPSGRAGCAHKHFLKPTIEQHFVRQFYGLP